MSLCRSTAVLALTLFLLALHGATASAATPARPLGSSVIVFDPSLSVGEIQPTVDAIHARQVDAEMGTDRYALLVRPGV